MAIIQYSTMLPIEAFGGIVWSLYAVAFLTTALRLYARAYITKAGIGLDDCLVVGGMVLFFLPPPSNETSMLTACLQ